MRLLFAFAIVLALVASFIAFHAGGKVEIPEPAQPVIKFSGYEWSVKTTKGSVGPGPNVFGSNSVWVDEQGRLHLAIRKEGGRWVCAEVISKESLGFGRFEFGVHETAQLDVNAVFGLFLWDPKAQDQNYREVDFELSRWGEPHKSNAQFVKQPFTRPENIDRYELPSGPARISFEWSPAKLFFQATANGKRVRQHLFTKNVFQPGQQQVRANLWLYQGAPPSDGKTVEVVIDSFNFLPMKKGK
jgi:hypothetical protein